MKQHSTFLFALLISSGATYAQLTLTGELRPRTEYRHGFKSLFPDSASAAAFVEQRSRLYLNYQTPKLTFQLNLQDVRIWGNTAQIFKNDPALTNIHEAWAELSINESWTVKMGRQELDYDNTRFLGNLSWAQQSRSHDALLIKYENPEKGWKFHAGGAYNQNVPFEPVKLTGNFYEGINNYKSMQFGWLNKKSQNGNISLLIHNDGRQTADTTMTWRQTFGSFVQQQLGKFTITTELYYQTGKDASKIDVSAWLLSANLSAPLGKSNLTMGADYLSGTSTAETKNTAFDPLYGTNHGFYGFMDYFYVGNPHRQNGRTTGLLDTYLKTAFPISKPAKLNLHAHAFFSPVPITNNSGREMNDYLGTEIDAVMAVKLIGGGALLNIGYSQLFATNTLEGIKGGNKNNYNAWIWTMLAVKPTLFVSEDKK